MTGTPNEKEVVIELSDGDIPNYIVEKLVNSIEFYIGEKLTNEYVQGLVRRPGTTVIVKARE